MSAPLSPLAAPAAWDDVANGYETDIAPVLSHYSREALRLAGVRAGMNVIDVAAGPGTLALPAAAAGAHVTALDFSPAMTSLLERRIATEGLGGITPLVGDGIALPFPDAAFDAGFSMFGLMFFPDRAKGFAELRRVLKPGAKAVVSSWVPMPRVPLMLATFSFLGQQLPDLMPPHPPPPVLSDAATCEAEMAAAGFAHVRVTEHTAAFTAGSVAEFAASLRRSNATMASLARRAGDRWAAAEARLLAHLAGQFDEGPLSMPMTALLTCGTR